MGTSVTSVRKQLQSLANPRTAAIQLKFFKTGPGEYGEGDVFLGIKVPPLREVAKGSADLPVDDVPQLLKSKVHEHRAVALMIWVLQFIRGDEAMRKWIYDLYLAHTQWINNWDLVDLSAPTVVGRWLLDRSRRPLMNLAGSDSLWERRIAIVSTLTFIRHNDCLPTLRIAERLMGDDEDLMHKACGWLVREVFKKDPALAMAFLDRHAGEMPRTMLRYALERCKLDVRQDLMSRRQLKTFAGRRAGSAADRRGIPPQNRYDRRPN